eukprot:1002473-Amorphochlora_amoeboformis.AAC.2
MARAFCCLPSHPRRICHENVRTRLEFSRFRCVLEIHRLVDNSLRIEGETVLFPVHILIDLTTQIWCHFDFGRIRPEGYLHPRNFLYEKLRILSPDARSIADGSVESIARHFWAVCLPGSATARAEHQVLKGL